MDDGLTGEGTDLDLAPQKRRGERDGDLGERGGAVPGDPGDRIQEDLDVEVTGGASPAPLGTLAAEPEHGAVLDARWDLDLDVPGAPEPAGALAGRTGLDHAPAGAVAPRAFGDGDHLAEAARLQPADLPLAPAVPAGLERGPVAGAVAVAVGTRIDPGDLEGRVRPRHRRREREPDRDLDVAAARPGARRASPEEVPPAPEELLEEGVRSEEVLQVARVAEVVPGESPRAELRVDRGEALGVVPSPFLGVGEDLVRLGELLEALLRGLGVRRVEIRVVEAGELSIGALDLIGGRGPRDPEHFVVVPFRHLRRGPSRSAPPARRADDIYALTRERGPRARRGCPIVRRCVRRPTVPGPKSRSCRSSRRGRRARTPGSPHRRRHAAPSGPARGRAAA